MSDTESISEEINSIQESLDSDVYNPYEGESDFLPEQTALNSSISIAGPSNIPFITQKTKAFSSTAGHIVDEDDQNYYSESFDDEEPVPEQSKTYSDDFEPERSRVYTNNLDSMKLSMRPDLFEKGSDIHVSSHKENKIVPSLDIQSFQAEQALEVLGREVVRLRNQQREVLRVRRQQAKDKKMRAESRRQAYVNELAESRRTASEFALKNDVLSNQVLALESTIKSLEETVSCVRAALTTAENALEHQRAELCALQNRLDDSMAAKEQRESEFQEKERRWLEKEKAMNAELQRKAMLTEVMQSAIEASEQR